MAKVKQTLVSKAMSEDQLMLFLHIPKTGGETLNRIIFKQMCSDELDNDPANYLYDGVYHYPGPSQFYGFFKEIEFEVPEKAKNLIQSSKLSAVLGHFSFGIHKYVPRPFKYVTFLRDPIERIVSLYHHLKPAIGIDDFLDSYVFDDVPAYRTQLITDNDQTRRISGVEPPFGKCDKEVLDVAKRNLENHFSVVGITARFNESLLVVKEHLGWQQELVYECQNVNAERPSVQSLSSVTIEAIKERNQLDIELYQYASKMLDDSLARLGPEFMSDSTQPQNDNQQNKISA